jgi:localization factor PodJL
MAALSSSETADRKSKPAPARSRLGKLSRVLPRKKGKSGKDMAEERREPSAAAEPADEAAPEVGLDQPLDPKLANQPLEPGSGAPDLNAIMRRVRDERGDDGRARDAEAAKSDFIAAARRAAQAAAAEAEVLKKKSAPEDSSGFSLKRLLRSNTKIVLLAAGVVLVGVAGTQLGKALLKESGQGAVVAKATPTAASQQTATKTEPAEAGAAVKPTTPKHAAPEHIEAAAKPDRAPEGDAMSPIVPLPAGQASADAASTAKEPAPVESDPAAASADTGSGAELQTPMNVAAAPATLPDHPSPANDSSAEAADGGNATAIASAEASTDETAAPMPATQPDAATVEPAGAAAPAAAIVVPNDAGPLPLREAAEKGDAKAMFEIGSRYAEGRGVASDMKIAAKWYEQAAERGYVPAEYRIGNFYEKGIGVGRDIAKAKDWYTKAADLGNAAAMHNLGVLYAMGADGAVDNEAAVHWFEKAAQLGVKDSQFNLGILAAKGVGMKQNLEESYKWFALVAKTGDKDAAAKRDEVANSLRPEQLEKARATVELWKAKPVDAAANVVDIPDAWKESDAKTASIDMKQAVRNIQLILNKNGYHAGAADGIMGDKTKAAIAAFQKANGMEPTGEVNEALVTALLQKK